MQQSHLLARPINGDPGSWQLVKGPTYLDDNSTNQMLFTNGKIYLHERGYGRVYSCPDTIAGSWTQVLDPTSFPGYATYTNPNVLAICDDPSGNVWVLLNWTGGGTNTTDNRYHLFKIPTSGPAVEVTTWWPSDTTLASTTGSYTSGGLEALPDGRIAIRVESKRAGSTDVASPVFVLVIVFDPTTNAPTKVLRMLPPGYTSSNAGKIENSQIFCKIPGAKGKTLVATTLVMTPGELNNGSSPSATTDTLLTFLDL